MFGDYFKMFVEDYFLLRSFRKLLSFASFPLGAGCEECVAGIGGFSMVWCAIHVPWPHRRQPRMPQGAELARRVLWYA